MELLQLKYFRAAAAFQNFSRVAEQFYVPQSSISKTVANLERELGCKLFTRSGKHVLLNENGKLFLQKVDIALNSLDNGIAELAEIAGQKHSNINLAVWEGSKLLPEILTKFRETNHDACFTLIQHTEASVLTERFDLCISAMPQCDDNLICIPLVTEEIMLAVPIQHPLAQYSDINLTDVQNDNFISLAFSKSLRRITDSYCNMHGFLPKVIFESDDAATIRGLIENGLGIAFIPEKTWKSEHTGLIKLLHIKDIDCHRTIAISYYKNRFLSPTAQLFREFVIDWYKTL